jgi:hypothetical protein
MPSSTPKAVATPLPPLKPKNTGNKCPSGLEYGKSPLDEPQPRKCRNCDKFDDCVDGK